ncbi:MAG TPA: glutathione S-transferase family protein [Candidatus Nanoarchaeia archaeon]|nr:glutathione S-transferase family protein [Candidatus Nanoarchaeia archaeon]
MITVYGIHSPHVYRLRATLIFKGLKFQHVSVNLSKRSQEFIDLSPVGKIPVLKDEDGTVVWDSLHITAYLEMKYPDSYKMLGSNAKEKATILNVVAMVEKTASATPTLYFEKYGINERMKANNLTHRILNCDAKAKEDACNEIAQNLKKLHDLLGGNKFFTGKFSFADAATLSLLNSLLSSQVDIGIWKPWYDEKMKDKKIAPMFASKDEKGVTEI